MQVQSPGREDPLEKLFHGEFHGQRILAGYSPWGCKETDLTEHARTHTHKSLIIKIERTMPSS